MFNKSLEFMGYPNYRLNNTGDIFSMKTKIWLKPATDTNGYLFVRLCKNGQPKYLSIHRLVGLAFIPNPRNKREINHKDGDKKNNRIENLEWMTSSENKKHRYRDLGLIHHRAQVIYKIQQNKLIEKFKSMRECARLHQHERSWVEFRLNKKLENEDFYFTKELIK